MTKTMRSSVLYIESRIYSKKVIADNDQSIQRPLSPRRPSNDNLTSNVNIVLY